MKDMPYYALISLVSFMKLQAAKNDSHLTEREETNIPLIKDIRYNG